MNHLSRAPLESALPLRALLPIAALLLGCTSGGGTTYFYPFCDSGVLEDGIDRGGFLELDPGEGVGATIEYAGDGGWRIATTCDSYLTNDYCAWEITVSSIGGTIDGFEVEGLESNDIIERFPTTPGSREEDGIRLLAITGYDIDAFTLLQTPGAGLRIEAFVGPFCGGPYLYWTNQGDVWNSSTNPTDLFPNEP